MNDYLNLLLDFQKLPREAKARTFMEVSGQAHYENVASNILAFYFDPAEEHGLNDLFISSFLQMAGHEGVDVSNTKTVEREYPAEDGKRIDLVIEGSGFVIGIENKIYHWEANDFANYGRVIDAKGADKPIKVKAVLGLHAQDGRSLPPGGFVRFSYAQLWTRVRSSLGLYLPNANPKWVSYLIDFMTTTSRLSGQSEANNEFATFYLRHNDVIEQLVADRQTLLNRLDACNYALEANLKHELEKHECISKVWVWQRVVFVVDFKIQGHRIALDLTHSLTEWKLTLFDRDEKSQNFARALVGTASMREYSSQIRARDGRHLLAAWDLHATQVELQDAVLKWVRTLLAAAAELDLADQTEAL